MSTQSDAFIVKYRPAAEKIAAETGIPVARILAQAGFESGWKVDAPGNNFFGVKAQPGYAGKSQTLDTTEAGPGGELVPQKGAFRVYDTPEDSFRDWAKVLQQDNFKGALDPNMNDAQFAEHLQRGGYGTDPNYATKLHGVIASTRKDLGQGPDGSVVTLATSPTTNIGLGPQPAMQVADVDPRTAGDADLGGYGGSPKLPGLLAAKTPNYANMAMQSGMGLMAAGSPQQSWAPSPMSLLQPHRPEDVQLPNFLKRQRGLLG